MLNYSLEINLRNKTNIIEKALDEADFVAKSTKKRLSRKEVFDKIKQKNYLV